MMFGRVSEALEFEVLSGGLIEVPCHVQLLRSFWLFLKLRVFGGKHRTQQHLGPDLWRLPPYWGHNATRFLNPPLA